MRDDAWILDSCTVPRIGETVALSASVDDQGPLVLKVKVVEVEHWPRRPDYGGIGPDVVISAVVIPEDSEVAVEDLCRATQYEPEEKERER